MVEPNKDQVYKQDSYPVTGFVHERVLEKRSSPLASLDSTPLPKKEEGIPMLNRVILIGRLTRDPELRYTASGIAVAQFTLAVDRTYSNAQGEKETDFVPIVTWRQLAENCANYLRKGRLAAVEGKLQTRNYENAEGKKVYVTEVVAENVRFLESTNKENASGSPESSGGKGRPYTSQRPQASAERNQNAFDDPFIQTGRPVDLAEDDLPF